MLERFVELQHLDELVAVSLADWVVEVEEMVELVVEMQVFCSELDRLGVQDLQIELEWHSDVEVVEQLLVCCHDEQS